VIAFDSNVLIYTLREDPFLQKEAQAVFREIALKGGVCSTLVITEVLYGDLKSLAQIPLLRSPEIKLIDVDPYIAEKAGQLRATYGLKNIDAVHIATAIITGAQVFVTNDQKILKQKVPGLIIRGL